MSDWKKNVVPAVAVLAVVLAFMVGGNVRTRIDVGTAARSMKRLDLAGIENPTDNPRSIPESELFYQLTLLLERDYVDPIHNERKLAVGAVKGMINGLWDPFSQFVAADHWQEFLARKQGVFDGIGIELRTVVAKDQLEKARKNVRDADPLMLLPELEVAMVAPGSPAERAGMAVGDRIVSVNGKWIVGFEDVQRLRKLQQGVSNGTVPADELKKVRTEFQTKVHSTISAGRAIELLTQGADKTIQVAWSRGGVQSTAQVTTGQTTVSAVTESDGVLHLRLFEGAAKLLAAHRLPESNCTIDLRQSSLGDAREIKPLLELMAPAGRFGTLATDKPGQPRTLATEVGTTSPRHYKLLVDRSTRGAAEILALALRSRGLADLDGGPMAGEPTWIETSGLPDGSGYSLCTGRFVPDSLEARN